MCLDNLGDWEYTDCCRIYNATVFEFRKPLNGGTLVMVVTESKVDDHVSTSVIWVPDAADKTPTV